MAKDKTSSNTSTTVTATPEETALNQMQLQRLQTNKADQTALDKNLYNTINTLLTGGTLPGSLQGIGGINEDQTQSMVNASLRDITPRFQSSGILDSGVAASISARTAGDIRNQNAQFNVSALQNILNQALGGASNLNANTNAGNQVLGSQLAGLRSTSGSTSTYSMNPFLKSFQTSFGSQLGQGLGQGVTGAMGGGASGASKGLQTFAMAGA